MSKSSKTPLYWFLGIVAVLAVGGVIGLAVKRTSTDRELDAE